MPRGLSPPQCCEWVRPLPEHLPQACRGLAPHSPVDDEAARRVHGQRQPPRHREHQPAIPEEFAAVNAVLGLGNWVRSGGSVRRGGDGAHQGARGFVRRLAEEGGAGNQEAGQAGEQEKDRGRKADPPMPASPEGSVYAPIPGSTPPGFGPGSSLDTRTGRLPSPARPTPSWDRRPLTASSRRD